MKYKDICCVGLINETNANQVNELVESMLNNGWVGAPILWTRYGLVTGSHRVTALRMLDEITTNMCDDFDKNKNAILLADKILNNTDVAIDVTDIVDKFLTDNGKEWEEIQFDCIGEIFQGTEIEQYKDYIREW